MKFRKKPVVIEATQWFKMGDHPKVIQAWCTPEGNITDPNLANCFGVHATPYPAIETLEGLMGVTAGDFIITGVKGEHYACKPDIFEMTYEKVE